FGGWVLARHKRLAADANFAADHFRYRDTPVTECCKLVAKRIGGHTRSPCDEQAIAPHVMPIIATAIWALTKVEEVEQSPVKCLRNKLLDRVNMLAMANDADAF